jgi:chromosome segregation ATPase
VKRKKLESSLHDERKFYDMRLQLKQKAQATLYSMYKEHRKMLQEINGAIEELEASLHRQYEELRLVRRERESLNRRIQELENKKQMKELNNKEVESSICSNIMKLAAVSVAVGVVAVAEWWFLSVNHRVNYG